MEKIILICNFNEEKLVGILKIIPQDLHTSCFVANYLYTNNQPKLNKDNPYLYINHDKISPFIFDGWRLLLVSDRAEINKYSDYFKPDTYVMHHSVPSKNFLLPLLKDSKIYKQGEHERGDKHGYPLINYIIKAYDSDSDNFKKDEFDEAFNKLIAWFGVNDMLELALEFLHQCLVTKPTDLSQLNGFNKNTPCFIVDENGKKVKKNIRELVSRLADKPLDNIKTFEDLRDALLELADAKQ